MLVKNKKEAIFYGLEFENNKALIEFVIRHKGITVLTEVEFVPIALKAYLTMLDAKVIYISEQVDNVCDEEFKRGSQQLLEKFFKGVEFQELSLGTSVIERSLSVAKKIIRTLKALDDLSEEYYISAGIVSEQFSPLVKSIIIYLKSKKIPVLYLVDDIDLDMKYGTDNVLYADVCMIGFRAIENKFEFIQKNHKKIIVTGLPKWDQLVELSRDSKDIESWKSKEKLNLKLPVVTFFADIISNNASFSKMCNELFISAVQLLLEIKKDLKESIGFHLIIKDNLKADRKADVVALVENCGLDVSEVSYVRDGDAPYIVYSDVVISMDSVVTVPAITAGTAVLNVLGDMSWLHGPYFGPADGVVNLSSENGSLVLKQLLESTAERELYIDSLRANSDYYSPAYNSRSSNAVSDVISEFMVSPANEKLKLYIEKQVEKAVMFESSTQDGGQSKIHFLIKAYEGDQEFLADTIDSIVNQVNTSWCLTVVADFDAPNTLFDELDILQWIKVGSDELNDIGLAHLLEDIVTEWLVWAKPGICFERHFVNNIQQYIAIYSGWKFIYVDEVKVNARGDICSTNFKPDFNLELLRSTPYAGELCLAQVAAVKSVSKELIVGVESYDVMLKIYDTYGEGAVGHIAEVLLRMSVLYFESFSKERCRFALSEHLNRNSIKASIADGVAVESFNVQYELNSEPMLTIIIEAPELMEVLKVCLDSIFNKTAYLNFDILIVIESERSLEVNDLIENYDKDKIQLILIGSENKFIAINEWVRRVDIDYLLFLDADCQVVQKNWLGKMLAFMQCKGVAVVAPRLIKLNKELQHAGLILGVGGHGVSGLSYYGASMYESGYQERLQMTQNLSQVSGDCLLIDRAVFLKVSGFEEKEFSHLYNDTDLCLKVVTLGYSIVWTPFVTLTYHAASVKNIVNKKISKQAISDIEAMQKKWLPQLANDPAYNRNLSLKSVDFQVDISMNVAWNVDFKDKPRVYAFPTDSTGVGQYRVRGPLGALTSAGVIDSSLANNWDNLIFPTPAEIERIDVDVLLIQNGFLDHMLEPWKSYYKFNSAFKVCGLDDIVYALPVNHPMQGVWPSNVRRKVKELFQFSDRVVVANEALAEEFRKMTDEIIVVPNYLENWRWGALTMPAKSERGKLRVGWAGGREHVSDLQFILPVVEALHKEVDWIFMGEISESLKSFVKESHSAVQFDLYPQTLANLDLDLAIAPLGRNKFNECKTNLRLLEFGIMGWPVICTDILPYQGAPVTRVANNVNEWIRVIREKINEPDALKKEGLILQKWVVDNYILEDHLDEWMVALLPSS